MVNGPSISSVTTATVRSAYPSDSLTIQPGESAPVVQVPQQQAYVPRLCHLHTRPGYDGYGFDLQDELGRKGHFVGFVDQGSPAEAAGLLKGDEIVEVNSKNVQDMKHSDVVNMVKENPDIIKLLVIDKHASMYVLNNNISVDEGHLANTGSELNSGKASATKPA